MANPLYNPPQPKVKWVAGAEERMPKNVGKYDVVQCEQIIMARGPTIRIPCKKNMIFKRVYESGLQFRKGQLKCNAFNGHKIQTHTMFIAICDCKDQHLDGQLNICCRVCIENYSRYANCYDDVPTYSIVKDYYQYKPMKRRT